MYYLFVDNNNNNKAVGKGQCKCSSFTNVEVEKSLYDSFERDKYIYTDGTIELNPQYEDIQKQAEQERVARLTMTALDFINALKQTGLTALQIKEYLDANIELDQQLKYCQNVYCGVVLQLCPLEIGDTGITLTAEDVVKAFKIKNGEVTNE